MISYAGYATDMDMTAISSGHASIRRPVIKKIIKLRDRIGLKQVFIFRRKKKIYILIHTYCQLEPYFVLISYSKEQI